MAATARIFWRGGAGCAGAEAVRRSRLAGINHIIRPDSAALHAEDGSYYAFATQAQVEGRQITRSADLAHWQHLGGALPVKPDKGCVILEASPGWIAPGHNALAEREGETLILYRAVDAGRPRAQAGDEVNTRRIMLTARLVWEDGWPRLAD